MENHMVSLAVLIIIIIILYKQLKKSMANKRHRFETSDVIKMLDSSTEDPMMCGSDDEFDDFDEDNTDPSDDERIPSPLPQDYTILATSTNIASTCIQTSSITSADNQHLPQSISPLPSSSSLSPGPIFTTSMGTTISPITSVLPLLSMPSSITSNTPLSSTPVGNPTSKKRQLKCSKQTSNPTSKKNPPYKEWTANLKPVIIHPYALIKGPQFTVEQCPIKVFDWFFTDTLKIHIVNQTNLYALQYMGQEKYDQWEPITVTELSAYLGFSILMGVVDLPAIEDYWKKDEIFHYSPVASRISRNRFRDISRYLHFADNTKLKERGEEGYDRLGKVRPIIEHFQEVFSKNYIPRREQSIDEAMIPFQGRSTMKQYMPLKPVKRGFKVWVQADAVNGYFCQFDVYTGTSTEADSIGDLGLGGDVVKKLTRSLVGSYAHIFFDNFFSSPKLLDALYIDKIFACGTVRTNRKEYPVDLNPKVVKLKER